MLQTIFQFKTITDEQYFNTLFGEQRQENTPLLTTPRPKKSVLKKSSIFLEEQLEEETRFIFRIEPAVL